VQYLDFVCASKKATLRNVEAESRLLAFAGARAYFTPDKVRAADIAATGSAALLAINAVRQ
jgi:hypothetical protein